MNPIARNNFLRKSVLLVCILSPLALTASAQIPAEPDRTQLLNGLRVVLLPRPGEPEVLLKLRIHSGAAFDLAGKEGSAALLGDILFPDPTTREYFVEEMQGRLNVSTDYDSVTITMQGQAREFERIVEILRTGLITTQLTLENVTRVRDGRMNIIRSSAISPSVVADRAISSRLFGEFPYGRPNNGTVESIERVQRSDLMLARERFLNANNATLVIIGGVQTNRAIRTLRQLLGGWRKSDQMVPATFRQPLPPDLRILVVNSPGDQSVEVRLAVRGFARKDPDSTAAALLAIIARERWSKVLPEISRSPVFVRHDAFALLGRFVMGTTIDPLLAGKVLTSAQGIGQALAGAPVSAEELAHAKKELHGLFNKELTNPEGVAEALLDIDTYGLPPLAGQLRALNSLSTTDLQRVAKRLFTDGRFASVVVGNAESLKSQLERYGNLEIVGGIEVPAATKADQNTAKPLKTDVKPE